jgi:hypothetical protein
MGIVGERIAALLRRTPCGLWGDCLQRRSRFGMLFAFLEPCMGIEPPIIAGQRPAADVTKNRQLFALLYSDLRRLAERQLRRSEAAFVSRRRCSMKRISECPIATCISPIGKDSWDMRRE